MFCLRGYLMVPTLGQAPAQPEKHRWDLELWRYSRRVWGSNMSEPREGILRSVEPRNWKHSYKMQAEGKHRWGTILSNTTAFETRLGWWKMSRLFNINCCFLIPFLPFTEYTWIQIWAADRINLRYTTTLFYWIPHCYMFNLSSPKSLNTQKPANIFRMTQRKQWQIIESGTARCCSLPQRVLISWAAFFILGDGCFSFDPVMQHSSMYL